MAARSTPMLVPLLLCACARQSDDGNASALSAKQAQVAERGRSVMPFDIDRTMHHFRKLPSGGVQQLTSADPQQVALIRQHLLAEAVRFQHGDYSDPADIHGGDMPGLKALHAGAGQISIRFSEIPQGAEIIYSSADPALVRAIHSWFDAQIMEHGRHAMPM